MRSSSSAGAPVINAGSAAHARASGEADFDAETDDYVVEDDGAFEPAQGALASA